MERLANPPQIGPATSDELRERLLRTRPSISWKGSITILVIALAYMWGISGTHASPGELVKGLPNIWQFLVRLMPPEWKTETAALATPLVNLPLGLEVPRIGFTDVHFPMPEIVFAIIETVQMALIGTTIAIIISFPFGLLAARNISPHRVVYQATRFLLNINRAVPDIIYALVFVAAVGLGPFSGVLALSVGAVGFMGKLYSEAIEAIDPQQVLAVSATGANRIQTFIYGVVPQALPLVASYSLLLFETNVRSATILGIVGAGGVGFILNKYMALFQYQYLMGALVLIIIAVTAIDRASDAVRRRLI